MRTIYKNYSKISNNDYLIFTKKRGFENYPEMDLKHLQTSNSVLFVLMVLSRYFLS